MKWKRDAEYKTNNKGAGVVFILGALFGGAVSGVADRNKKPEKQN